MSYVVASSECDYALRLAFCHSADKKRYAQIISGYVPVNTSFFQIVLPPRQKGYSVFTKLLWHNQFFIDFSYCWF